MNHSPSVLCCIALFASGLAHSSPARADAGAQVLAAEAAELAAWEAGDIEGVMNAYAPGAVVMPGGSVIPDRAALRKLFEDFLADPGFALTFRSDPPLMAVSEELGVTVGTYAVTFTDPESREVVRRTGRHLMTWKRQEDGQWRIVRQMTAHDR